MNDRTVAADEPALERGALPPSRSRPASWPDQLIPDALSSVHDLHWVPLGRGTWVRPLQFNVTIGQWTHFMRVTRSGVVARHRHTGMVHAYVFRGRGTTWSMTGPPRRPYVFEPPGETHTLVVPDGCDEMVTLFQVNGSLTVRGSRRSNDGL